MKKTKILYWVFTGAFAAAMLASSIPDALCVPEAVKYMAALGYPVYLIRFLGVMKILGVIAVLIPGNPRLKEWAYAGLFFDLAGATYSQIATGVPASGWALMSIWFMLLFGSYMYHQRMLNAVSSNRQRFQTA